nr:MAG TPA: hypothetical protein [Caudoviricetes sp.]
MEITYAPHRVIFDATSGVNYGLFLCSHKFVTLRPLGVFVCLSYVISGVVQRLSVNDCIHRQASHKYAPIVFRMGR